MYQVVLLNCTIYNTGIRWSSCTFQRKGRRVKLWCQPERSDLNLRGLTLHSAKEREDKAQHEHVAQEIIHMTWNIPKESPYNAAQEIIHMTWTIPKESPYKTSILVSRNLQNDLLGDQGDLQSDLLGLESAWMENKQGLRIGLCHTEPEDLWKFDTQTASSCSLNV